MIRQALVLELPRVWDLSKSLTVDIKLDSMVVPREPISPSGHLVAFAPAAETLKQLTAISLFVAFTNVNNR